MDMKFSHSLIVAQHDFRRNAVTLLEGGRVKKQFATEFPLDVQLLPGGEILCTGDGDVIRLDRNFRETWRYSTGRNGILTMRQLADGRILIGDMARSRICLIDAAGTVLQQFEFPLVGHPDDYYLGFRMLRVFEERMVLVAAHKAEQLVQFDFQGKMLRRIDLAGPPYQPLPLSGGELWVSLGPSGKIARFDETFRLIGNWDMAADCGLERGWIAGLCETPAGTVICSDSRYDRLLELDRKGGVVSIFQDRNELLHPASCAVIPPDGEPGGPAR